jgi:hypothetical protein
VPYGLAVLALLLGSLRFLMHLPATTRRLFLLAGAIYVGGALGMELVEAAFNARGVSSGFIPLLGVAIEETMEMLGVTMFIYALLTYIRTHLPGFVLSVKVSPPSPRSTGR